MPARHLVLFAASAALRWDVQLEDVVAEEDVADDEDDDSKVYVDCSSIYARVVDALRSSTPTEIDTSTEPHRAWSDFEAVDPVVLGEFGTLVKVRSAELSRPITRVVFRLGRRLEEALAAGL